VNAEGKRGVIWPMHSVYSYENGTVKPNEIVLRGERENDGGGKSNQGIL
jgi:hypothetical protein